MWIYSWLFYNSIRKINKQCSKYISRYVFQFMQLTKESNFHLLTASIIRKMQIKLTMTVNLTQVQMTRTKKKTTNNCLQWCRGKLWSSNSVSCSYKMLWFGNPSGRFSIFIHRFSICPNNSSHVDIQIEMKASAHTKHVHVYIHSSGSISVLQ